jgi:hypothetical protein
MMRCSKCESRIQSGHHKWGGHGEDLYKCPACQSLLSHKYGIGAFMIAVVVLVPLITICIEFLLSVVFSMIGQSASHIWLSGAAGVVAAVLVFAKMNRLVITGESDDNPRK